MGIWQRLDGWAPYSLWLDDLWVAVLAKSASLPFIWTTQIPTPPGFVFLLKLAELLPGDGAWRLQLLPLLFSLLQLPLIAALVVRLTGSHVLGGLAALLLVLNTNLATYSLRIKHFSLDGLVTLLALWLLTECLREHKRRSIYLLMALCAIAPVFSFASLFMLAVCGGAGWLVVWRTSAADPGFRRALLLGACALGTWLAILCFALFHGRANPELVSFWKRYYLPIDSLDAMWGFFKDQGRLAMVRAFPQNAGWMAWAVPVGLIAGVLNRRSRFATVTVLGFYLLLLVLSAARLYPFGAGRLDIFAFPVTLLVAVLALGPLQELPWGRGILALVAAALSLFLLKGNASTRFKYNDAGDREIVECAVKHLEEGDALLIFPTANWAVGYYGPWESTFGRVSDSTNGYFAYPLRANTVVLHETLDGKPYHGKPEVIRQKVRELLANRPRRLVGISTLGPGPEGAAAAEAKALGYTQVASEKKRDGRCMVFVRSEQSVQ